MIIARCAVFLGKIYIHRHATHTKHIMQASVIYHLLDRISRYNSAVQTETIQTNSTTWHPQRRHHNQIRRLLADRRFAIVVVLACLVGVLAFQAPPTTDIAMGWFGDRLFFSSADGWMGDELSDSQTGRSRWASEVTSIHLPGIRTNRDLILTLRAQGWPNDAIIPPCETASASDCIRQPTVIVEANGNAIGQFEPTTAWEDYAATIPAADRPQDNLTITLKSSATFTDSERYTDPREKAIRVEYIGIRSSDITGPSLPVWFPLGLLIINSALGYIAMAALTRRPTLAFVATVVLVSLMATGIVLARSWSIILLPWITGALLLLLLIAKWQSIVVLIRQILYRYAQGNTLNYGLIAAAVAWMAYVVARASDNVSLPGMSALRANFADTLLFGMLGAGMLILLLVLGRRGLPWLCHTLVNWAASRQGAYIILSTFLIIWIGYEAYVIAQLNYVGHADYADNAVVARNLVEGRGWVVDYVSQFYYLNDNGVTRPQETWPLLQPVWIAPFFAWLGPTDLAARLPNLIFMTILATILYAIGTRLWDRRVGLTAVVFVLTSHLFFKLAIYATTDLAFVVFSILAIYLVYRWAVDDESGIDTSTQRRPRMWRGRWGIVALSGLFTGLMMLQKPASGVLIAFGTGLWLLIWAWQSQLQTIERRALFADRLRRILPIAAWTLIAMMVLSPYLVRNVTTFDGRIFYSTESYDAWILGYSSWEDLYKVYTTDANLSETGGLPEPNWILRWGFDQAMVKLTAQVEAARSYLLPPWRDLPLGLSEVVSGSKDGPDPTQDYRLLFSVGAWLSFLGILGAIRLRRRLITLLLLAFTPYTLFLITYWRADEERYFVMVMPWLALFAAYALWRGYDRIAEIGDGRWTPVGLALAVTAMAFVIQPSWPIISEKVQVEPWIKASDLDAYKWIRENTDPDDVIMTRVPWQLNWHTERPAVMIPNTTNPETLMQIARYYDAKYLISVVQQRPYVDAQEMLDDQLVEPGILRQVYESPSYNEQAGADLNPTYVYTFPEDYDGVAELSP
ncbi:MAG: glycosyltransferase family 39 protein [Chloroflexota bacterium]